MFDLPDNKDIAKLAVAIYENGGIVSAVCHGPVGMHSFKFSFFFYYKYYWVKRKSVYVQTGKDIFWWCAHLFFYVQMSLYTIRVLNSPTLGIGYCKAGRTH